MAQDEAPAPPAVPPALLITAAVLGIVVIVLLISWLHVHPFLALVFGSAVLGVVGGLGPEGTINSFSDGVGSTVGGVGVLIALGSMIGGLLADSGGADRVVEAVTSRVGARALPWALAGVAALIGLPLFFEVGVVLLVPVVLLVAARARVSVLAVGIPALAGLSVLHGLVPPHPGPLVAIDALGADLGITLAFGLIVAVPTVIVAGPLFAKLALRWVPLAPPAEVGPGQPDPDPGAGTTTTRTDDGEPDAADRATGSGVRATRRVSVGAAVAVVLTPVVLMLLRAVAEVALPEDSGLRAALEVAGEPVVALLAGVVLAMLVLGAPAGLDRRAVSASIGGALPPIAGILLIVGAGGGFKQTLIDAGVGDLVGRAAEGIALSPLILGWLVAVGIRVATGSATVATITAAGIVAPLAADLNAPTVALLALAIGAGSLFFSHVNDAGFWLVKEYFGLTVGQTIKSWSVMETIISVVGLALVLVLSAFV
ncbi:gluconate:H+ symporter [Pseudonocardia lacus]|uniref:GntT/GntP/DsdX family permease n=1 Tax=Pseudonocardia lacus TaxID=2835865 RepID=UPI002027BBEB